MRRAARRDRVGGVLALRAAHRRRAGAARPARPGARGARRRCSPTAARWRGTNGRRSSGAMPAAPKFIGDMPHTWVGSGFVEAVRDLFAYEREDDRALVLAAGIPAELAGGRAAGRRAPPADPLRDSQLHAAPRRARRRCACSSPATSTCRPAASSSSRRCRARCAPPASTASRCRSKPIRSASTSSPPTCCWNTGPIDRRGTACRAPTLGDHRGSRVVPLR